MAAEAAAASYRLPEVAADWTPFDASYLELGFAAWYRELGVA
jgi:hypothetical protein